MLLTQLLRGHPGPGRLHCFRKDDPVAAQRVEPLEETMDQLTEEIRSRHIQPPAERASAPSSWALCSTIC